MVNVLMQTRKHVCAYQQYAYTKGRYTFLISSKTELIACYGNCKNQVKTHFVARGIHCRKSKLCSKMSNFKSRGCCKFALISIDSKYTRIRDYGLKQIGCCRRKGKGLNPLSTFPRGFGSLCLFLLKVFPPNAKITKRTGFDLSLLILSLFEMQP